MGLWHKLVSVFKRDEPAPLFYKKIVAIRGEVNPGKLQLHLGTFNSLDDQPTADPGVSVEIDITQKIRPSVNRILAGQETLEDVNVLELAIQKLL